MFRCRAVGLSPGRGITTKTAAGPFGENEGLANPSRRSYGGHSHIAARSSVAAIAGIIQSTWWLPVDVARQLCYDLGAKLLPTVEGGTG